MRFVLVMTLATAAAGSGLSAAAQPPPELEAMQGKYQATLQNIARTYEGRVTELNRSYLAALENLRRQLEARGDDEGLRLVEAEIDWVEESRDQIPHPWELMDAASEGVSYADEAYGGEPEEAQGPPLVLGPFWNRSTRSGRTARKELEELLSPYCEAGVDLSPAADLDVCPGVAYLMPVEEAILALGGEPDGNGREEMETPGFPDRSFFYHACTGTFEGRFDTALLVTDNEDKVIAVQFSGHPLETDRHTFSGTMSRERGLYDLARNRRKASADHAVGVLLTFFVTAPDGSEARYGAPAVTGQAFTRTAASGQRAQVSRAEALQQIASARDLVLRVDTLHADGYVSDPRTQLLDRNRLYLPRPIVGLVLERSRE